MSCCSEIERTQAEGKHVTFRPTQPSPSRRFTKRWKQRGVDYVLRIPTNKNLELEIEDMLFRPPGRPSRKPLVRYKMVLSVAALHADGPCVIKTPKRLRYRSLSSLRCLTTWLTGNRPIHW